MPLLCEGRYGEQLVNHACTELGTTRTDAEAMRKAERRFRLQVEALGWMGHRVCPSPSPSQGHRQAPASVLAAAKHFLELLL